ncbi:MAG: cupin domain-containing protein [Oscillospiraceae bacterium]|nr:cupin domain-containing protein [Oscillospiraceae bacterium]
MNIIVRKPTAEEIATMQAQPTWGCGVSKFDWSYDSEETALIIEGEVTVTFDGGSVFIQTGDLAVFPKGMSCVWDVTKPINKHYLFR